MPNGQVAQLVRLTRIPRPTVHRLPAQLRAAGAVDRIDGYWSLASGLMGLALLGVLHPHGAALDAVEQPADVVVSPRRIAALTGEEVPVVAVPADPDGDVDAAAAAQHAAHGVRQ
ncbi:hypothetical protein JCM9534A_06260 [Catenuloplanes indicus JCM 9534]